MLCYECSKAGRHREAVDLCHNCSAALCGEHAFVTAVPITKMYPICKSVVLAKKARQLLCATCLGALRQVEEREVVSETSKECCTPAVA
jgi:hypothetical protein